MLLLLLLLSLLPPTVSQKAASRLAASRGTFIDGQPSCTLSVWQIVGSASRLPANPSAQVPLPPIALRRVLSAVATACDFTASANDPGGVTQGDRHGSSVATAARALASSPAAAIAASAAAVAAVPEYASQICSPGHSVSSEAFRTSLTESGSDCRTW